MDGFGLILVVALGVGIGILSRQRYREGLPITQLSVRCPINETPAEVAVRRDPRAQSCRQYVDVASCSLLPDAAVGLPERFGYLPDGPPLRVRLDPPTPFAVPASQVACRQPCVFVLNTTAVSAPSQPLTCTSGISDSLELARQTIPNPRISRLLWYSV